MLTDFSFSLFRLTLEAIDRIELARFNKGITLRGAFGAAFRRLVCYDFKTNCNECSLKEKCAYARIFNPTIPSGAKRLRKNLYIPRPFVIKPPLDNSNIYYPGDEIVFYIVIIGNIQDLFPFFIVTFEELGHMGIGPGRGKFYLKNLHMFEISKNWRKIYDYRKKMVKNIIPSLSFSNMQEEIRDLNIKRLKLKFLTPVLLKERQRWKKPYFAPFMKRLRDRISALSYFYTSSPLVMDFKTFGEVSEKIKTKIKALQWVEERRFSRRIKGVHILKGFLGEVEYHGDLDIFLPFIKLGEYIHVGKATAFGQGWYTIEGDGHDKHNSKKKKEDK